jgi:hypothetical protein
MFVIQCGAVSQSQVLTTISCKTHFDEVATSDPIIPYLTVTETEKKEKSWGNRSRTIPRPGN